MEPAALFYEAIWSFIMEQAWRHIPYFKLPAVVLSWDFYRQHPPVQLRWRPPALSGPWTHAAWWAAARPVQQPCWTQPHCWWCHCLCYCWRASYLAIAAAVHPRRGTHEHPGAGAQRRGHLYIRTHRHTLDWILKHGFTLTTRESLEPNLHAGHGARWGPRQSFCARCSDLGSRVHLKPKNAYKANIYLLKHFNLPHLLNHSLEAGHASTVGSTPIAQAMSRCILPSFYSPSGYMRQSSTFNCAISGLPLIRWGAHAPSLLPLLPLKPWGPRRGADDLRATLLAPCKDKGWACSLAINFWRSVWKGLHIYSEKTPQEQGRGHGQLMCRQLDCPFILLGCMHTPRPPWNTTHLRQVAVLPHSLCLSCVLRGLACFCGFIVQVHPANMWNMNKVSAASPL